MLINIIDVGQPNTQTGKNGRSYQSMEVTYKDESGKVNVKKLMSFSNPSVFNHIKSLTKGDQVNIVTAKDANGYWQWTGIGGDENVAEQPTKQSATPTRVTGSNYETKEERAARQVLIVRQSSVASAVAALAIGAKSSPSSADVIKYAKEIESYVFGKAQTLDELSDDLDDIPL